MPSFDKLVLLPTSFPDRRSFESNFLDPELPHLLDSFEEVHLLPSKPTFSPPENLPAGVTLHKDLSDRLGFPAKHKLLLHALKGISIQSSHPPLLDLERVNGFSKRKLADLANLGMAACVCEQIDQGIQEGLWPIERTLFYSYWCKYTALGMAWLREKHPKIKTIARAHRGDLYPDEAPCNLITRQSEIISGMDRVFVISENGADFLKEQFPESSQKIAVARLGTLEPEGRAQCSSDGILRLVSCSTASPVKRLDRIVEAAKILTREKDLKIEWLHFGGGSELNCIRESCAQIESSNLSCTFAGNTPLEDILRHYIQKPVDVFINSSRSEGIPVSMMEAMSTGIPCVAPSVGGIPELLQEGSGGVLISSEAKPQDIADACLQITTDREAWTERSNQAFGSWSKNYSANNNFSRFAQEISTF